MNKTAGISISDWSASIETLIDRRHRWSQLLQHQHYEPLITEVLEDELPKYDNSRVINPSDRIPILRECILILNSAPRTLLTAVQGNLVSAMQVDADLQAENTVICQRAITQPSIYVHFLTDKNGIAPSAAQYLLVRDYILDYIATDCLSAHAWAIDNMTPPPVTEASSSSGYRKYLHTRRGRSSARVAVLTRLIAGIIALCSSIPPILHHAPLPFPPAECGYSMHSLRRIEAHKARRSSNYVMNLVEDICDYLHASQRLPQRFYMHAFIVALLFRPAQAPVAEIFCSGLLQVWVDGGMGFNGTPAGRSVASAGRIGAQTWSGFEDWVRRSSGLVGGMERLRSRAEEWRRAVEWDVERVARGVEESEREDVDEGE